MQSIYTKVRDTENLLKDRAPDLNTALKQGEEHLKSALSDVEKRIEQGKEQVKTVMADVDKRLHENPWPIVAGVAVGCILLGFFMGFSKK
ncbi:MAG: hypothetical protein A2Z88_02350 [Omnitrophica WOR_2 bacterium GWA2_47_8]|nr:MAG: hypothetical protein A2Z88_02350 [Omnitrophica WOR_2 bacterium GWA2_47_8]